MRLPSAAFVAITYFLLQIESTVAGLIMLEDSVSIKQDTPSQLSLVPRHSEIKPNAALVSEFVQKTYQEGLQKKGGEPVFYTDGRRVYDFKGRPLEEIDTAELIRYSDKVRPRHGPVVQSTAETFKKPEYEVKLEETVLKRFGLPWDGRQGEVWLTEDRIKGMLKRKAEHALNPNQEKS